MPRRSRGVWGPSLAETSAKHRPGNLRPDCLWGPSSCIHGDFSSCSWSSCSRGAPGAHLLGKYNVLHWLRPGSGGHRGPAYPSKRWGALPPHLLKGFPCPRDRPNPKNLPESNAHHIWWVGQYRCGGSQTVRAPFAPMMNERRPTQDGGGCHRREHKSKYQVFR
jgi:hypothetical protein